MENNYKKKICIRIKSLQEKKGEYQKETAEAITKKGVNLSEGQLGLYEIGARKLPPNILNALSEHFNTTTDYLLGRTDDPNEKKYKHLDNTLIGRVSTKIEKMDDDELELLDKLVDKLMKDDK